MFKLVCIPVSLVMVLMASTAWADVPNPDAEPCSVADSSADGRTCESCSASYEDPDECANQYAGTEFTQDCTSGGASVWTEVWCKGEATDTGGCYGTANGVPTQAWLAFLPLLGLLFFRVRRHFQSRG